jgi:hypothetical protein
VLLPIQNFFYVFITTPFFSTLKFLMTSSVAPIECQLSNKYLANSDLLFAHYKSRKYSVYLIEYDLAVCPIYISCYNQDSLIDRYHICAIYWCLFNTLYVVIFKWSTYTGNVLDGLEYPDSNPGKSTQYHSRIT